MKVRRLSRRLCTRPHTGHILGMVRTVRRLLGDATWPGPGGVVLPLRGIWTWRGIPYTIKVQP